MAARCCLTLAGEGEAPTLAGEGEAPTLAGEGEAPTLAPPGEAPDGREVGEARVRVPDVGGEELPEAALRAVGGGEERQRCRVADGQGGVRGGVGRDEVGEHGPGVYADMEGI